MSYITYFLAILIFASLGNHTSAQTINSSQNVIHSHEISESFLQINADRDFFELVANSQNRTMQESIKQQYIDEGYDPKYAPKIGYRLSVLEIQNGDKIGINMTTVVYDRKRDSENIDVLTVMGLKGDELHKVMCIGVQNLFEDKACTKKVEEVFGRILPKL